MVDGIGEALQLGVGPEQLVALLDDHGLALGDLGRHRSGAKVLEPGVAARQDSR